MKLYISVRQTNKTEKCIAWLLEDPENRVMYVINELERLRVVKLLVEKTGETRKRWYPHVLSVTHGTRDRVRPGRQALIDNAEMVLGQLVWPDTLSISTMSEENVEEP